MRELSTGTDSAQVQHDSRRLVDPPDQTAATSTAIESLTRRYGELRDEARLVNSDIVEGHHAARRWRLDDRTSVKARSSISVLLNELAVKRGMTWSSIARLCNVSVSAVRKWRKGEDPSPEKRLALARLAAFIDLLDELPVSEPAAWLAMPMVSGYTVIGEDLYVAGLADRLLDLASSKADLDEVLITFDKNWRTHFRSDYEVIEGGDGMPSIVRRGGT